MTQGSSIQAFQAVSIPGLRHPQKEPKLQARDRCSMMGQHLLYTRFLSLKRMP